jgi:hypothetical protein
MVGILWSQPRVGPDRQRKPAAFGFAASRSAYDIGNPVKN